MITLRPVKIPIQNTELYSVVYLKDEQNVNVILDRHYTNSGAALCLSSKFDVVGAFHEDNENFNYKAYDLSFKVGNEYFVLYWKRLYPNYNWYHQMKAVITAKVEGENVIIKIDS